MCLVSMRKLFVLFWIPLFNRFSNLCMAKILEFQAQSNMSTFMETILNNIARHCIWLRCTALYCTRLNCTALNWAALHWTVLHCTALHCTSLHRPVCTGLLSCGQLHYPSVRMIEGSHLIHRSLGNSFNEPISIHPSQWTRLNPSITRRKTSATSGLAEGGARSLSPTEWIVQIIPQKWALSNALASGHTEWTCLKQQLKYSSSSRSSSSKPTHLTLCLTHRNPRRLPTFLCLVKCSVLSSTVCSIV